MKPVRNKNYFRILFVFNFLEKKGDRNILNYFY